MMFTHLNRKELVLVSNEQKKKGGPRKPADMKRTLGKLMRYLGKYKLKLVFVWYIENVINM